MHVRAGSLLLGLLCVGAGSASAAPSAQEQAAMRALKGRGYQVRVEALASLKGSHDPDVVRAVMNLLKDPDATVRWAAVDTLDAMGDAAAVPALQAASKDPSPLVSSRARAAWSHLAGATVEERRVRITATDRTHGEARLQALLMEEVRGAFAEKKVAATTDDTPVSHVAAFNLQSIKETPAPSGTVLEVACTATVSQQPSGALRFATRVAAAVELPANTTARDRKDAVDDALKAAAGGLAQEAAEWLARAP
jgi:hypothetical protein